MNLSSRPALVAALTVASASSYGQVVLNVGDIVSLPEIPEPTLTIVDVKSVNFTAATFSGTLTSAVAKTAAFGDNLIFAWIVSNNQGSAHSIGRATFNGWTGFTSVVAQHDASSLVGNPGVLVDRADRGNADVLGYDFFRVGVNRLTPGSNTKVFWALSNATVYKDSFTSLQNGSVTEASTFAPDVVPEPGTILALAGGLALLRRRKR